MSKIFLLKFWEKQLQVTTNLTKLGLLKNINEDNTNRYGEIYANNELFDTQLLLLKKYLYNNVYGTISKIKNNKSEEALMMNNIPTNRKIRIILF